MPASTAPSAAPRRPRKPKAAATPQSRRDRAASQRPKRSAASKSRNRRHVQAPNAELGAAPLTSPPLNQDRSPAPHGAIVSSSVDLPAKLEKSAPHHAGDAAAWETGWHDIPEADYHGDPCPTPSLSSHVAINVIAKSLAHAWRGHPRSPDFEPLTPTPAIERGRAAHALLFGGAELVFVTADDWRTAKAREARDDARREGKIALLEREQASLMTMSELAAARFDTLYNDAYQVEQTALWRAPGGGWRRSRLDSLSLDGRVIVDYKTTEGPVDAHSCERRISDQNLHIQAAAYVDAVEALHPGLAGRIRFFFQWQEQRAPFALSPPIEMSEAFLTLGREQWRAAGRLWDLAIKHNAFPAHSSSVFVACPPPWELSRWEERQVTELRTFLSTDDRSAI